MPKSCRGKNSNVGKLHQYKQKNVISLPCKYLKKIENAEKFTEKIKKLTVKKSEHGKFQNAENLSEKN